MARSTSIYVVVSIYSHTPQGAFTVKRECKTWLRRRREDSPLLPPVLVNRMKDNPSGGDVSIRTYTEQEFMEA